MEKPLLQALNKGQDGFANVNLTLALQHVIAIQGCHIPLGKCIPVFLVGLYC